MFHCMLMHAPVKEGAVIFDPANTTSYTIPNHDLMVRGVRVILSNPVDSSFTHIIIKNENEYPLCSFSLLVTGLGETRIVFMDTDNGKTQEISSVEEALLFLTLKTCDGFPAN